MEPTAETSSYLPWDTSAGNRFVHYSSEDHAAPLWIASLLALIYSIGILSIRIYIKIHVFSWDDYLISASTIFASGHCLVIYSALKHGPGKTTEMVPDIHLVSRLVHSSRVLSLILLYTTKISILFLLRRLFIREQKVINLLCHIAIGCTITSGIVSVIVSTINCSPSARFSEHCQDESTRWVIITALDIITEILAMLLPAYLVWELQMHFGSKFRVIAAFWFRVSAIVLSVLHLNAVKNYASKTPSPIDLIPSLVWQEALITTALITATVPNMRGFVQSLSGSWGDPDYDFTKRSTKYSVNATFELKNTKLSKLKRMDTENENLHLTPNPTAFEAHIGSSVEELEERGSLGSNGSQDMIIRKQTAWTVERS